eukprot:TRINITY_DN806_c0_g1_i1.p1 TRINITY_DN806_c0_g1~~TRINITY_DN806_c0_g1_i1.p1  ORF type:complete len:633 (-),score=78.34 TRINITY_DN806_c0_g1_i1:25-1923(-)
MENAFLCPITQQRMRDPVQAPDGHTYERSAIEEWLHAHQVSPITRQPIRIDQLVPNYALRTAIEAQIVPPSDPVPERSVIRQESQTKLQQDGPTGLHLCLVLDTSGSMGSAAPPPDSKEDSGLSVLDVVRHSCATIITILNTQDTLAIVQFNSKASTVLAPTRMDDRGQRRAKQAVDSLEADGDTALWQGLQQGLEALCGNASGKNAVLLLTDGQPTRDPPSGAVRMLQQWRERELQRHPERPPPVVHAFGFGYDTDCDLLDSLAKTGEGFFGFIPDSSMIGTVFVSASVWLRPHLRTVPIERRSAEFFVKGLRQLAKRAPIASLLQRHQELKDELAQLPDDLARSCFLENWDDQVAKAVSREDWYQRWGRPYLISLARAVELQISANFRDPAGRPFETREFIEERERAEQLFVSLPPVHPTGPFAPAAQQPPAMDQYMDRHGGCFSGKLRTLVDGKTATVDASNLAKGALVWAWGGDQKHWGWAEVDLVMASRIPASRLLSAIDSGCSITAWHPVREERSGKWRFPAEWDERFTPHNAQRTVAGETDVFSVVLRPFPGEKARPQGVLVGGVVCATLAHGSVDPIAEPVLGHEFFGSEDVARALRTISSDTGIASVAGFMRARNGRVSNLQT